VPECDGADHADERRLVQIPSAPGPAEAGAAAEATPRPSRSDARAVPGGAKVA
jgi:hypothetical protein